MKFIYGIFNLLRFLSVVIVRDTVLHPMTNFNYLQINKFQQLFFVFFFRGGAQYLYTLHLKTNISDRPRAALSRLTRVKRSRVHRIGSVFNFSMFFSVA